MTIKEIARLANVSSAAVSRYLNGGYISEEKRAQIKKVIEETGYHPSAQARTLRTKRASLIGVVVPKINSESISRVTEGIGSVLAERGYQMLLASTDNNAKKEIEYLLEPFLKTAVILKSRHPQLEFVAAAPRERILQMIREGIQEFMAGETRFAALDKKAPEVSKQLKEELAKSYSERYKLYKQLADLPHPGSN